jgi:hypothetical protein
VSAKNMTKTPFGRLSLHAGFYSRRHRSQMQIAILTGATGLIRSVLSELTNQSRLFGSVDDYGRSYYGLSLLAKLFRVRRF